MHVKTPFLKKLFTNHLQILFLISIGVLLVLVVLLLVTWTSWAVSPTPTAWLADWANWFAAWRVDWQDQSVWVLEILRIVFGSIALLFLPGYWLTKALYFDNVLDTLEVIALSFAFSISVVPLLVFYANLAGVPITAWLVVGVCALIIWGSRGYLLRKTRKDTTKKNS